MGTIRREDQAYNQVFCQNTIMINLEPSETLRSGVILLC